MTENTTKNISNANNANANNANANNANANNANANNEQNNEANGASERFNLNRKNEEGSASRNNQNRRNARMNTSNKYENTGNNTGASASDKPAQRQIQRSTQRQRNNLDNDGNNNYNHNNSAERQTHFATSNSNTNSNVNSNVNANANSKEVISFNNLKSDIIENLNQTAQALGIEDQFKFTHYELIIEIVLNYISKGFKVIAEGVLETLPDGYGFLRFQDINYTNTHFDIFVQAQKVRKWNIKSGDFVQVEIKAPKDNEKYFVALDILAVNGEKFVGLKNRVHFEKLTPIYPEKKINFELQTNTAEDIALRACDLIVPIGFGQRALIIAQPRTGKTVLMQNMAHAITHNHPEVKLIVLLIDERPEEVTDMKRSVRGEVISSTFDEPATKHIQLAELVIEKAKRMVEIGEHVVIFLDSITRLARAYNTVTPSSGKVLTGGIDASAMEGPKKIFGAARNTEEKGSLTIIATALDKNKSQMDYYILQEFSGTGNCELYLDKSLSDRRIYPAIDITLSGTRNEERFFDETEMCKRFAIRKIIIPMGSVEGMSFLISKVKATTTNKSLFDTMNYS